MTNKQISIPTEQELFNELNENNQFFDMLVEMIPSKLYVTNKGNNDNVNTTKQNVSSSSTINKVTTTSNNSNRFYKTATADTKESRHAEAKLTKRQKISNDKSDDKENNNKDTSNVKDNTMDIVIDIKDTSTTSTKSEIVSNTDTDTENKDVKIASRIEQLRSKLEKRLQQIRAKMPKSKNEDATKKRKERLQQKIQRREDALRNKKKLAKQQQQQQHGGDSNDMITTTNTSTTTVTPDIAVDLQTVDFGIIGGLNPKALDVSNVKDYTTINKSLSNIKKGKNLNKLLVVAQEKQQKILNYKQSTDPNDKEKLLSIQWNDTLKEADGIRIKDDPTKIKKTLARKVAKKQKSTKSWQSRMEHVSTQAKEKQSIRKHNLDSRKIGGKVGSNLSKKRIITQDDNNTTNKNGKKIRAGNPKYASGGDNSDKRPGGSGSGSGNSRGGSKGKESSSSSGRTTPKSRPGFEGKKQGFINR